MGHVKNELEYTGENQKDQDFPIPLLQKQNKIFYLRQRMVLPKKEKNPVYVMGNEAIFETFSLLCLFRALNRHAL